MKRIFRCLISLFLVSTAVLAADDTSKPALMSRNGGGKTWSDLGELQRASDAGNPDAMSAYGEMLVQGDQVTKDVAHGTDLLSRAAKAGSANAAFRLGKMYDDGDGVPADAAKALAYYQQAALAGVAEAQYNLGAMYVSARDGLKRDFTEGLAWLIVATKNGAQGDGEKQVRDRLVRRPETVAAAEQRAAEIGKQIAEHQPAKP